jgi:hypothetical protein
LITGQAPVVFASDNKTVLPGVGVLIYTGHAPTITTPAAETLTLESLVVQNLVILSTIHPNNITDSIPLIELELNSTIYPELILDSLIL